MQKTLDWLQTFPLWQTTIILAILVGLRAQATYWCGKLVQRGLLKTKWAKKISRQSNSRGVKTIQKWGWPIIPLSFLTIGLQTIIQFSAGLIDIKWSRYTLAAIPGYIIWALIYASGGLTLFNSIVTGRISYFILFVIIVIVALVAGQLITKNKKT